MKSKTKTTRRAPRAPRWTMEERHGLVPEWFMRVQAAAARKADAPDALLTITDICAWWQVDRSTLHRWRGLADFPKPVIIGSSMRWRRVELVEYLTGRRAASAVAPVPVGIRTK